MAQSIGSNSITMARLIQLGSLVAIALGLFGLMIGAGLLYGNLQGQLATEQASRIAEDHAREVSRSLESMQRALVDPQVQGLAREALTGTAASSQALVQAVRTRGVSNILDLRVFPESVEDIEPGIYPEPDFGVVEMLIEARRNGRAPSQVHYAGSANENLAFAEAVRDSSGELVGLLFMRVPVSAIASLINDVSGLDYLALVQGQGERAVELRSLGTLRRGDLRHESIEGSQLGIRWSRSTLVGPLGNQAAIILLAGGIILLMGGLLLRRRTGLAEAVKEPARPAAPAVEEAAVEKPPAKKSPPAPKPAAAKVDAAPPKVDSPVSAAAPEPPEEQADLPDWLLDDDGPAADEPMFAGDAPRSSSSMPDLPDLLDGPDGTDEVSEPATKGPEGEPSRTRSQPDPDPLPFGQDDDAAADHAQESDDADEGPDLSFQPEPELEEDFETELEPEPEPEPKPEPAAKPTAKPEPVARAARPPLLDPALFRGGQILGKVEDSLDARSATLIGQAIGTEARERGIERMVVGRDGRLYGATLLAALSQGLRVSGIHVIDVGAVPIPVLNFAAHEMGEGSGVMVTGSHYSPEINGFRVRLGGQVLHDDGIQALYRRIQDQDFARGEGTIEETAISERYIERIGVDVQLERPLKVVLDCANGIAGAVAPQVLSAIGADVIPLYADVDGSFPNHLPNPADPDNLEDLKLCVRNFQADLGIAFDGDGDRLAVVANNGSVIWADRLLMLLARELLGRLTDVVVVQDVGCSAHLATMVEAGGGRVVTARSADAFVADMVQREGAQLGGLASGHVFINERWYPFDDAIYASARLLEIFAADTRSIAEILADLPEVINTPEIRLPMASDAAAGDLVMALLADSEWGEARMTTVDGLRVDFSDGWGLVRASHTGPELVLRFEAEDAKALNRIKTLFKKQIKAVDSSLSLMF